MLKNLFYAPKQKQIDCKSKGGERYTHFKTYSVRMADISIQSAITYCVLLSVVLTFKMNFVCISFVLIFIHNINTNIISGIIIITFTNYLYNILIL